MWIRIPYPILLALLLLLVLLSACAFILSLGPPAGAGAFVATMTETAHLRLAVAALKADDVIDAKAHLRDLIATSEGETKQKAEEIQALLERGQLHDAEHELGRLLLTAPGAELTDVQLHLVLTLDALQNDEIADAISHLEEAVNLATDEERDRLQALLTDLQAGRVHDVEHELQGMLEGAE